MCPTPSHGLGASPAVPGPRGELAARRAAVIGYPVAHSLSPVLHQAAYESLGLADWRYERWEFPPEELAAAMEAIRAPAVDDAPLWSGLSVTMPHKQRIIPMLDVLDPLAQTVGVVNTVVPQRSGRDQALLTGFNTDVAGIAGALREAAAPDVPLGSRAVILGSGATASSALAALTELGATDITVAARQLAGPLRTGVAAHRMGLDIHQVAWKPGEASSDALVAELLSSADMVISTLPAGAADGLAAQLTADSEDVAGTGTHVPPSRASFTLRPSALLLDVVYHPWPTALATVWEAAGGVVAPGWLMLLHQAVPQVQLMTGYRPDIEVLRAALLAAL